LNCFCGSDVAQPQSQEKAWQIKKLEGRFYNRFITRKVCRFAQWGSSSRHHGGNGIFCKLQAAAARATAFPLRSPAAISLRLACDRERYAFTPLQWGESRVVHMGRTRQLRRAAELSRVLEKASDLKAV
jgi:hypothetical protein